MKVEVQGYCDGKFDAVKELFRQHFEDGLEVGASFAATVGGRFVVDIWGGYTDAARTRPWERDTIVNVFSTTKAMTAICAHILIDRGQLDVDAPVARYWPEFAQAGKERIPVRYILSHQSGVVGYDKTLPKEAFCDWDYMIKLVERQRPWWEPGTHCGYHAGTFGYIIGEVVRRITGQSLGTFFREEVAIPLNADFYIGVPEEHDHRVAEIIPPANYRADDPGEMDPGSMMARVIMNNPPAEASWERAYRAAEVPSGNGHGNARAMARVGAAVACGGELDGVRLMGLPTVAKVFEEQCYGIDLVLEVPIHNTLGFILVSKEMPVGPNPRTVFRSGWGGSLMVIDLDARMSLGYAMNNMDEKPGYMRGGALTDALYASLA